MKKALALTCALSLALLLVLVACNRPQTKQPDASQPAPASSQADAITPAPDNTPAPEPPVTPAPAQLSDAMPAAPASNEDPQDQADAITPEPAAQEPAAQEPAAQEPVSEPVQPETPPVTAENSPAETKPAEQTEPQPSGQQKTIEDFITHPDKDKQTQQQDTPSTPSGGGTSIDDVLAANPGAYVDENGHLHLPFADDYKSVKLQ